MKNNIDDNMEITTAVEATKEKKDWFKTYVAIVLLAILAVTAYQVFKPAVKWQYKSIYIDAANVGREGYEAFDAVSINMNLMQLNEMGREGWEVVGVFLETETAFPNFGNKELVTGLQPNIRPQRLVIMVKRKQERGMW